jgi:soluble lytic murein transglycosylase-like protein
VAVLSAYDAGEGKVKSWLKTGVLTENAIPYPETRAYVKKVLKVSSFLNLFN